MLSPLSHLISIRVLFVVASIRDRCGALRRCAVPRQAGQATAEYALVLLGAAAVALMLTAWAAKSGAISRLFDAVVDQLIHKVG